MILQILINNSQNRKTAAVFLQYYTERQACRRQYEREQ